MLACGLDVDMGRVQETHILLAKEELPLEGLSAQHPILLAYKHLGYRILNGIALKVAKHWLNKKFNNTNEKNYSTVDWQ